MTASFPLGVLAGFLVAVGVAACGGAPPASTPAPQAATAPAPTPTANPGDVHFIVGMIHHHGQALAMVELMPDRVANRSLLSLGERIRVSQTDEIALMQLWLRDHGEEAPEPSPQGMRMMHDGMEHHMLMAGMITPEQMAELEAARGEEFDRLFLTFMIQHHEGALLMVEELFATHGAGQDTFIYKLASDAFADQGIEIDRMERMLEAMAGQSP